MAEMNPTVVITHLDDDKLRKSIDSLVNYVDEKFKAMTTSTTNAVNTIQKELQKLGSLNAKGVGGAGGGEFGITKALQRVKQEAKESSMTFDQMATSMQKATTGNGNKTIFSTMDTEISILKEKLVEAKSQVESFTVMARRGAEAGDKGLFVFSTENLHKAEADVATLTQQINNLTAQRQALKEMLNPQGDAFKNYVNSLTKANPELAALNAQYKEGKSLLKQQTDAVKEKTKVEETNATEIQKTWEMEQKLHQEQGKRYDAQNEINRQLEIENAKTAENLAFQEKINAARAAKEGGANKRVKETNELTGAIAGLLGIQEREVAVTNVESASQHRLANYLNQLKNAYQRLDKEGMNASHGKMLADEIQRVSRAYAEMTKQMNRPTSLKNALGLDESTLDKIAYKIQQLNAYRAGLNITKQAGEMRSVETAIDRLKKKQDELMGKNQQLIKSNNALTRSWNYMKNRLAFYFTVGASTQFVKNLIEVRSQYEMNERALGILIDSAERGTQIFNELSQMALVSPYTLIELSTAAKQLSAYDVAAKDLVDTTRRLADISAAVGLPVERLTTALGQIKAFEHLTSMTARRFSSAGIPLIKALADHFTELEGRMVSVADVYDRMKKKAISYNDVMAVITEMTDEGGKFFDFQAKMADTLKVQLANLTLAWNNMLNDIGKSEQGVIVGGIKGLKELFLQWKNIDKFIRNIAWTFGIAKFIQIVLIARRNTDLFTSSLTWNMIVGKKLTTILSNLGGALGKIITSPLTWWALLATSVVSAGMALYDANKALKEFNKSIADGGKENFENTKKFLEQYKEVRNSLYKNEEYSFVDPSGIKRTRVRTVTQNIDKNEAEKTWVAIREQIELTSQSSDYFIGKLLSINDVNKRVEKGFDYLQKIQDVYGAMASMDDDTIAIKETYNAWWNLGLAQDGVIGNLKEYIEAKKLAEEEEAKGAAWHETETVFAKRIESFWSSADIALQQYRADLDVTLESMANFAQTQGFDFDQEREFFAQTINKIVTTRNLGEREALQFRLDAEERYREARIKQFDEVIEFETKRAGEAAAGAEKDRLLLRVQAAKQEKAAWLANQEEMYGEGRALFEGFTKYMTRNHGSELQKLFGNMTKKEIEQINWSEPRWKQWAEDNAKAFAEQFGVSFDKLKDYVNDANQMTIFIKTIIQKPDDKSVYDTLTEADKAADEAWSKIQRLNTRKNELLKKGASVVGTSEIDKEYANTLQEITDAQDDYNKALAKGGHSKKENTTNTKAQKQAETELQKALKDELSLLDKVRSQYKKLTDAGVDGTTALNMVTNQFTNSIQRINNILGRNGLPLFNIKAFAGTDNPNAVLGMLKKQLDAAKVAKNIKPEEIKELEVKYGEIVIDAKVYNTKKITDGLNNELSKIKDEYELAVELDANPELGGIFMDIFDIDPNNLPNTIDAYATKVMEALNRSFEKQGKGFRLDTLSLTDDDLKAYKAESEKQMGAISEEDYKIIEKYSKEIRNLRKKDREDTLKQTQELQYKLGDVNEKIAIESKKLADLQVKYQKETNEEKKRLLDLQIKDQKNTIAKLGEEVLQMLPTYKSLFNSIAEHSAVVTRRIAKQWKGALVNAVKNPDGTYTITDPKNGKKATLSGKEYGRQLDKVNGKLRETQSNFQKIREAFKPSDKDGVVDYAKGIELIAEEAKKAADGLRTVADIVTTLGRDDESAETLNDIATTMEGVATAAQGYAKIQSGDIIGGATDMVKGTWQAVSTWLDNGDKKISKEIEKSERQVRKLELAYIDLEHAIEKAYGTETIGAQKAAIANKELQLAELKRQLTLEQSRKKKHQDQDRIIELQKQIKELEYDIKKMTKEIVNDLLGISSIGSFAEDLVSSMISAFKNGEDYMLTFEESFDKMIDNIIMKSIVSRVVAQYLDAAWADIDKLIKARTESIATEQAKFEKQRPKDREEMVKAMRKAYEPSQDEIDAMRKDWESNMSGKGYISSTPTDDYFKAIIKSQKKFTEQEIESYANGLTERSKQLEAELKKASVMSDGDIHWIMSEFEDAKDSIFAPLVDELKKWYTFGESASEDKLSALQQGIQGITEDTASALEGYMNGVSQQVYLQSDLLTQIRDAVVMIDSDTQMGVQAQMLLQLQQTYAVQMAIQNILQGWSNPSGMAMRVEMVN